MNIHKDRRYLGSIYLNGPSFLGRTQRRDKAIRQRVVPLRARRWRQGAPLLLGAFYTGPPNRSAMRPRSLPIARRRGLEEGETGTDVGVYISSNGCALNREIVWDPFGTNNSGTSPTAHHFMAMDRTLMVFAPHFLTIDTTALIVRAVR